MEVQQKIPKLSNHNPTAMPLNDPPTPTAIPPKDPPSPKYSEKEPERKKQKVEDEEDWDIYPGLFSDDELPKEVPKVVPKDVQNAMDWDFEVDWEFEDDWPVEERTLEESKEIWAKYIKQIKDSKGFDVDCYPGSFPSAIFLLLNEYLTDPAFYNRLMEMAREAIKHFEDEPKKYEVVNVEKVVCTHSPLYLITFKAKELNSASDANAIDIKKIFQAVVARHGPELFVHGCRIKPTN